MGEQVDEVLGGQPEVIQGVLEDIQRRLQVAERRQREIHEATIGTHKAIVRDWPPRIFLLVPPLKPPVLGRVYNMFNRFSQTFHMYFVCEAFLDDLRKMENGIPPDSMDPSPEFSKPLLVKQSAVRAWLVVRSDRFLSKSSPLLYRTRIVIGVILI